MKEAFTDYQSLPNKHNHETLKSEKDNLDSVYKIITEEDLDAMIQNVEKANSSHQHAESWKLINEISGRKSAKKGVLKGNSKTDRLNKWYTHFSELLGKEPNITGSEDDEITAVLPDLGITTDPFTMDEYLAVKKRLIGVKRRILMAYLKQCDIDQIMLEFANKVLVEGDKPQQWSVINIIPLPKSGDLGFTTNYRGISLTSIASKVMNKMLLNRIQPHLDPHLRPNQNGFRPKRSTTAHILALRIIIE